VVGPAEHERRRIQVDQRFAIVGRDARANVHLDARQVCPRHAFLHLFGSRLFCVDLGSQSGTYRGLTRITTGWLNPREFLRIGPCHVRWEPETSLPSPDSDTPPPDPLNERLDDFGDHVRLSADVLRNKVEQARWRMTRRLVLVGRDPSARLRLQDLSVSRFHCSLVATPEGTWVIDLLSREGTYLNNEPITAARVQEGDHLRIGCYDLHFRARQSTVVLPSEPPPAAALKPAGTGTGIVCVTRESPTAKTGLSVPVEAGALLPILQQFGLMQQQMMDQFQQTIQMVLQTVTRMHQGQMDVLQKELAHLRELTSELNQAKQQLATAR
jgi:pSer/pThr/pTyr-binding forkhead associated (FHA) protein